MLQNPTLALSNKQASSSSVVFSSNGIQLDSPVGDDECDSILFINDGTACRGLCGEDAEDPFSGMPASNRSLSEDPSQEFWCVLCASLQTLSPEVSQHVADDVGVSVKSLLSMQSSLHEPLGTGMQTSFRPSQNDVLLSLHRILRASRASLLHVDVDVNVDIDRLIDSLERVGNRQAATTREKSLLFPVITAEFALPHPPPLRPSHESAHVPVPGPRTGGHEQGEEEAPLLLDILSSPSRAHTHSQTVGVGRPQLPSSANANANANLKPFSFASIVSPLCSNLVKASSREAEAAEAEAEGEGEGEGGAAMDPVLSLCLDHNDGDGEAMDTASTGGDYLSLADVSNDAFAFSFQHQQRQQHQQQQQHASHTPLSLPPAKKHCTYSDRE
jgi:hypothetical protein